MPKAKRVTKPAEKTAVRGNAPRTRRPPSKAARHADEGVRAPAKRRPPSKTVVGGASAPTPPAKPKPKNRRVFQPKAVALLNAIHTNDPIRRSRHRMSPLLCEGRCNICKLAEHDVELFDLANGHLIEGGSLTALYGYLKRERPDLNISYNTISSHRQKHLRPTLERATELRLMGDSLAEALGSNSPVNLAITLLREISISVHWTVMRLLAGDDDALTNMLNDSFQSLLRIGADVAGKLSSAERTQTQTELDRANLELRKILLAMKSGDHMKAVRALLSQAAERMSPTARAEVAKALEAMSADDPKALPSEGTGAPVGGASAPTRR